MSSPTGQPAEAVRRHAVVTGGSSGIGAATCEALLACGYHVTDISLQAGVGLRPGVRTLSVDLTDARAAQSAFSGLAAEHPATTVIHCAGAIRERSVDETTAEDVAVLAQLHLGAALSLVQANLNAMRAARFGRIVLVASRAVLGLAGRTAYASTKAGMLGLSRTWALELASYGITSNVVAPGPIAGTEMFNAVVPDGSGKLAALVRGIPVGRVGTPQDVARAIMFFASPESDFVTGQTLYVCGGTSVASAAQ